MSVWEEKITINLRFCLLRRPGTKYRGIIKLKIKQRRHFWRLQARLASKELNKLFPCVSELQAGIVDGDLPQKSNLFGVITAPCLCLEKSLVADGTLPPLRKHGCQPLGTAALIIALHHRVSAIWPRLSLSAVRYAVYCVLCVSLCHLYPSTVRCVSCECQLCASLPPRISCVRLMTYHRS